MFSILFILSLLTIIKAATPIIPDDEVENVTCEKMSPICTDDKYKFYMNPNGEVAEGGLNGGNNYYCKEETNRW